MKCAMKGLGRMLFAGWLTIALWLLSTTLSWAQTPATTSSSSPPEAKLVDLAGGIAPLPEAKLQEGLDVLATTHGFRLKLITFYPGSPFARNLPSATQAFLQDPAPAMTLVVWTESRSLTYHHCQVQVNDALATRLPATTAEQLLDPVLHQQAQQNSAPLSLFLGIRAGLQALDDYLSGLPDAGTIPTITFANPEATGSPLPPTGLDAFTHEVHRPHYEQLTIQEQDYPVAWKALPSGQSTPVLAQVPEGMSFPPGVVFRQEEQLVPSQVATQPHQRQLNITGQMHEQEGSVHVYASDEEDTPLIGRLNTISYDVLPKQLVLIALDGAIARSELPALGQAVQTIYAQAGVRFTVSTQAFDTDWGDRDVALEDNSSGLFSNYPTALKRVIKDYRKEHEIEKETAYVFVAGKSASGRRGYMPKKRPYGFVFTQGQSNQALATAIAHELGHGLFRLEHTWQAYSSLAEGSTDNLMDYRGGRRLHKYQWDLIHHPQAMLGWFQDDEENAYTSEEYAEKAFQIIRCGAISGDYNFIFDQEPDYLINSGEKYGGTVAWQLTIDNSQSFTDQHQDIQTVTGRLNGESVVKYVLDCGQVKIEFIDHPGRDETSKQKLADLQGYLFTTSDAIVDEFNAVWNGGISDKIENNQDLNRGDIENLKSIANCGSQFFTANTRYKLIKAVFNYSSREYYEDLVLDMLVNSPDGQPSKDLFGLINGDASLLQKLVQDMNNYGWGVMGNERNFDRLAEEYLGLFHKGHTPADLQSIYDQLGDDKKLYFYGFSTAFCEWDLTAGRNGETLNFEEQIVKANPNYSYNPLSPGSSLQQCTYEEASFTLAIDDLIAVSISDRAGSFGINDGLVVMPAVVYYTITRSRYNDNLKQFLEGLWFAVGIVTPIDEFYLLGKALQYGSQGFRAVRFTSAKLFAKARKVKVNATTKFDGQGFNAFSQGKVDEFVEVVDEGFSLRQIGSNEPTLLPTGTKQLFDDALEGRELIRFENNQYTFQSAKTFFNEKNNSFYEAIIEGKYYIKYDVADGRILFTDSKTGQFYAFAQSEKPTLLLTGSDQQALQLIGDRIQTEVSQLKYYLGLTKNRSLQILGKTETLSDNKISTLVGRLEDVGENGFGIDAIKEVRGDFRNALLGENSSGLNTLNRPAPNAYWFEGGGKDAFQNWMDNYNMPWMKRAVDRQDDVYVATQVWNVDRIAPINAETGLPRPAITAYELRYLQKKGIKPKNLTTEQWNKTTAILDDLDFNNYTFDAIDF